MSAVNQGSSNDDFNESINSRTTEITPEMSKLLARIARTTGTNRTRILKLDIFDPLPGRPPRSSQSSIGSLSSQQGRPSLAGISSTGSVASFPAIGDNPSVASISSIGSVASVTRIAPVSGASAGSTASISAAAGVPGFIRAYSSDELRVSGFATTTAAVTVVVDTIKDFPDDSSSLVKIWASCEEDSGGTDSAVWEMTARITRQGGTLTLGSVSTVYSDTNAPGRLGAIKLDLTVNGAVVDIEFTGTAARNYKINATHEIMSQSINA